MYRKSGTIEIAVIEPKTGALFSIYWMDFQWVMGMKKGQSRMKLFPLYGIVEDYRAFIEDFKRVLEFVE